MLITAISGTATMAPPIPPMIEPAATPSTTPSGWTRTARPRISGCRMCPSICWTATSTTSIISAVNGPWVTSAISTAMVPVISAPTSGTNAPRKMITASGRASGTPSSSIPMPMNTASMKATQTVPRTYAVSVAHAFGPAPAIA